MPFPHEVLIATHPAVGRGLPRLASQGRAVNHHHREPVAALRNHVPHIHLIDGDVPPRSELAWLDSCLCRLFAADEEAPLCLQHEGSRAV